MFSYAVQGISSLLFGPILGLVSLYAGSDPGSDSLLVLPAKLWVSEPFVPVARSIHQTNMIIAFSVLFATLLRVRRVCPMAERNFLQHLVGYEVLAAVICILSYLPVHESSRQKKTVMLFYIVATVITFFVARGSMGLRADLYASTFEAITKHCVQQHDWPLPEISFEPPTAFEPPTSFEPPTPKEEVSSWVWALAFATSPLWATLGYVVVSITLIVVFLLLYRVLNLVNAVMPTIMSILTPPYMAGCHLLRVGPMRLSAILVAAGFPGLTVALFWTTFWALLVQRQRLRAASGGAYQDNDCKYFPQTFVVACSN
jgi:hypothetical protein